MTGRDGEAMQGFEEFSRAIGARLDLVQGAGGNTSIKTGDRMRIKASGAWLAEAGEKPIFVEVDLKPLRAALVGDFDDASLKVALKSEGDLRPSIETPLHALSPFAVVAHVHSANAIAWSVRADAQDRLAELLDELDWAFIPYERPGAPLAKATRAAFDGARPRVLIFGNHGLVVAGDTVEETAALLDDVERRLAISPVAAEAGADYAPPAPPPGYRWTDCAATFLAHDKDRVHMVAAGSLYPDHVVFLGPAMLVVDDGDALATMIPPPKAAIVNGVGILAREDLTRGAMAMLDCLGLVAARLAPEAPINYLTAENERELLGWDAETHRQALDRRTRSSS